MNQDRYLRHSLVDWFDQAAVRNASILVVGAGATGNETLKNLALLGVGQVHIVDLDRIEVHNLTRSVLFREEDVGLFKADVAAAAIARMNPDTKTSACIGDFWGLLTPKKVTEFDAVFCCVDNYEARLRLNRLCMLAPVDLYNCGIDSRFVSVEQYPFRSQPGLACYECGLPQSAYAHMRERYSCGWLKKRAYEEKKIPTTTITSSVAGALMCSLFLQRTHARSMKGAIRLFFDTITGNSNTVSLPVDDDCFSCQTLGRATKRFATTRKLLVGQCLNLGLSSGDVIWLSDALILTVQCSKCRHPMAINDLADKYDDSLMVCSECGSVSNYVEVKDSLTLAEMCALFGDRPLPVKYVWCTANEQQTVIELED